MMSFLVKLWGNDEDPDAFYHIDDGDSGRRRRWLPSSVSRVREIRKGHQNARTISKHKILSAVRASRSSDTPLDVRVAGARLLGYTHSLQRCTAFQADSVSETIAYSSLILRWLPVYPSFVVVVVVIISIILEQFNLNERVLRSCDGACADKHSVHVFSGGIHMQ